MGNFSMPVDYKMSDRFKDSLYRCRLSHPKEEGKGKL